MPSSQLLINQNIATNSKFDLKGTFGRIVKSGISESRVSRGQNLWVTSVTASKLVVIDIWHATRKLEMSDSRFYQDLIYKSNDLTMRSIMQIFHHRHNQNFQFQRFSNEQYIGITPKSKRMIAMNVRALYPFYEHFLSTSSSNIYLDQRIIASFIDEIKGKFQAQVVYIHGVG